jgi:hypothetical protein
MSTSETIDDGGPAFPTFGSATQIVGMSLLDYFAGQALANSAIAHSMKSVRECAESSYAVAIAMLNERERINASKD